MTNITIVITLHPQHTTTANLLAAFQRADALGVDTIWTWDHFFPITGDLDGSSFEAWTILAACGVQTERANIGCLVHGIGYRNPALLSAMAKTLDHFLGGRLILGLGAGWTERDFAEYGYEYGTAQSRLKDLERGVETIKTRWQIDQPPPPRGSVPIMIGGSGEKVTLRIAALHADLWHSSTPPEEWGRKNAILNEWCAKVGRDPGEIRRSASISDHRFDPPDNNHETLIARAEEFVAVGVNDFIFGLGDPFDMTAVEILLQWRDANA